ncbi:hypothetical protein IAR55_000954 [Kwoniella newhampshirensis]|uniref:Kinase n=1 Tax=Kwoniella newhampshirensis TaxID=1651941 RepID=A0AAW0Z4W4_9TREE
MTSVPSTSSTGSHAPTSDYSVFEHVQVCPLTKQAGGHANTMSETKDGSQVFKMTEEEETKIYNRIYRDDDPLSSLRSHIPRYAGHFSRSDISSTVPCTVESETGSDSGGTDRYRPLSYWGSRPEYQKDRRKDKVIVLQDTRQGMSNPSYADIKLGTTASHPSSSALKKRRQEELGKRTTTHSLGFRLVGGCTVHGGRNVHWTTEYGENVTAENIDDAMITLFPSVNDGLLPAENFTGRSLNDIDRSYLDQLSGNEKLDRERNTLQSIRRIQQDVSRLSSTLRNVDETFVGSSLFVVWEDGRAVTKFIDLMRHMPRDGENPDDGVSDGLDSFSLGALETRAQVLERSCRDLENELGSAQR